MSKTRRHETRTARITKPQQQPVKAESMTKLLDLRGKIESMVQTILDDVNERHPNTMDELLQKNEFGQRRLRVRGVRGAEDVDSSGGHMPISLRVSKAETAAFELLRASLDLIFCERYGWTVETIDKMTLPEVFIALEHALEYDAPSKKSVWNL